MGYDIVARITSPMKQLKNTSCDIPRNVLLFFKIRIEVGLETREEL